MINELFGINTHIFFAIDNYGHPIYVPNILKMLGIDSIFIARIGN